MGVKNPLIDGVIQLLAELFLTEEEKMERINITQQRSTSSPCVDDEILIIPDSNKRFFETFSTADLVFIAKSMCIKQAIHFFSEIIGSVEFQKQMGDSKEEDRSYIRNLLNTFEWDANQWTSFLKSFPDSLKNHFFVEY